MTDKSQQEEKTKELFEAQKSHLAEKTPEGVDPNFKTFVEQMPEQFKSLLDDAQKQIQELAERGRAAVKDMQAAASKPKAEAFDLKDDSDAPDDETVETEEEIEEQIHVAEEDLIAEGGHVEEDDIDK
jgi:hypothetical protein